MFKTAQLELTSYLSKGGLYSRKECASQGYHSPQPQPSDKGRGGFTFDKQLRNSISNHPPSLTFTQAKDYAFDLVSIMPLGSRFTCYQMFKGIETRFNRKLLGLVINDLIRHDLIERVDYVKSPRENGNAGIAALFEKIKEVA